MKKNYLLISSPTKKNRAKNNKCVSEWYIYANWWKMAKMLVYEINSLLLNRMSTKENDWHVDIDSIEVANAFVSFDFVWNRSITLSMQ